MGFKDFYKKRSEIEKILTKDGMTKFLKEKEGEFDDVKEEITVDKFLIMVNDSDILSLLVFSKLNVYKVYVNTKAVLNWSKSIVELRKVKEAGVNPIRVSEGSTYDLYIFPSVGEKKYKVQRSLFYSKPFVDKYNEMLEI